MEYKFIKAVTEGEIEYFIYLDEVTGNYYKINNDDKTLLTDDDLKELDIDKNIFRVVDSKKKKFSFKRLAIIALAGIMLYASIKEHSRDIKYVFDNQTAYGDYFYLRDYQVSNETISDELQYKLPQYFEVLANLGIKESKMVKIANRLGKMDFTGKSELEVISLILDLDSDFVANELYSYINRTGRGYYQVLISDLFTLERDAARRLINGESLEKLIKELHNVKITTDLITEEEIEVIESINNQTIENLGFGQDPKCLGLNNNIFEEYVKVGFGTHNFYGKLTDDGLENMTPAVYMQKLNDFFYANAKYIDYTNQDDRFLVYLYANSLLYGPFFNMDMETPEVLYQGTVTTIDNIGKQPITTEEMYLYLEEPKFFSYKNIPMLGQLAYYGDMGIYILQEVNLCLGEEVKAGNLSQEQYDNFIDVVLAIYEKEYPELAPIFEEHALKNKSIDGFQIQLINPEL